MLTLTARGSSLRLLALLFALGSGACSSSSAVGVTSEDTAAAGQGPGREADPLQQPDSLEFDTVGEVALKPGASTWLRIQAEPPGTYQVRFALLGDTADASLGKSEATTSPSRAIPRLEYLFRCHSV